MSIFISLFTAFITTFVCLWLLQPLAKRIGLVDLPTGRKQHQGRIPLIGGIAIFLGFLFALLTLDISLQPYRAFLAGCALLVFVGVLDDFHELSARARFVAQTVAGLMMVLWGKVSLHGFGDLLFLGNINFNFFSMPITVLAVIGIINAVNMTDGIDGLAGGLALIELMLIGFLAFTKNANTELIIILLIIASLLAFLWFNFRFPWRKRALVFMGDAGSMFLGFALVWFLVELSQGPAKVARPVTMLWIMIIPLYDIISVMIRRLQKGQSVLKPDREHLHYLLQAIGFNPIQITLTIYAAAAVCGAIGILLDRLKIAEGLVFTGFIFLFLCYLWLLSFLRAKAK